MGRGETDPAKMPLTFKILSGTGDFVIGTYGIQTNFWYRINSGPWVAKTNTETTTVVSEGDVIEVKGDNFPASATNKRSYMYCTSGVEYEVYGNILSLPFGESFIGKEEEVLPDYAFYSLFANSSLSLNPGLLSAAKLILPSVNLARYCYGNIFQKTKLVTPPVLYPSIKSAYCYGDMFKGCAWLTYVPELPEPETLAEGCFAGMFNGCTSLIEAPELPATSLQNNCYASMFYGCTSLILAPELHAPTLKNYCYYRMFYGCSQLGQIICPATNISANYALSDWLNGVAAQGTFYKRAGVTWPSGDSGIPSGWTVIEV